MFAIKNMNLLARSYICVKIEISILNSEEVNLKMKFNSDGIMESAKGVLYFVLLMAIINILVLAFVGLSKTTNVTDWEVTQLPQENSLYAYTYNSTNTSSTAVDDPANWQIKLDTDGEPVYSDNYQDYKETEATMYKYVTMPLGVLNIVLGGLLLLSILLQIFGIDVGKMIGGSTGAGKKRRTYD